MDKLFYTNVSRRGDYILLRGINNGKAFSRRIRFNPTLFVPSNTETKYKTLEGSSVSPVNPGTMKECRDFIQTYSGIKGFDVYGNTDYIYQFIGKIHPGEVEYDFAQLKVAYIDIETTCELGFPNVDDPQEEINAITMIIGDNQYVLGLGEFEDIKGAECHRFFREEDLGRAWKISGKTDVSLGYCPREDHHSNEPRTDCIRFGWYFYTRLL